MKKIKFLIFILIFVYTFYFQVNLINAQEGNEIRFRPNISIPGMQNFFDGEKLVSSTNPELGYTYPIDGESIPRYISAVYSYAAVFAGVVAMFMLVFAAYQWLFAAGNAEKIGRARETIQGVLVGLTLLFGGNLLLSQISNRLVDLNPISPPDIVGQYEKCSDNNTEETCKALRHCIWTNDVCIEPGEGANINCPVPPDVVVQRPANLVCCKQYIIMSGPGRQEVVFKYEFAIVDYSQNQNCDNVCQIESSENWIETDMSHCTLPL